MDEALLHTRISIQFPHIHECRRRSFEVYQQIKEPLYISVYIAQTLFDVINDHNRGVEREKVEPKKRTLALAVMVDDLDRCSKENVMEMLKATHLLLEQPNAPMVVFLAVDPQLVISAIAESFEGVPNTVSCFTWVSRTRATNMA